MGLLRHDDAQCRGRRSVSHDGLCPTIHTTAFPLPALLMNLDGQQLAQNTAPSCASRGPEQNVRAERSWRTRPLIIPRSVSWDSETSPPAGSLSLVKCRRSFSSTRPRSSHGMLWSSGRLTKHGASRALTEEGMSTCAC